MSEENRELNHFYLLGYKDYQYFGRPQIEQGKVSEEEYKQYMQGWNASANKYNE